MSNFNPTLGDIPGLILVAKRSRGRRINTGHERRLHNNCNVGVAKTGAQPEISSILDCFLGCFYCQEIISKLCSVWSASAVCQRSRLFSDKGLVKWQRGGPMLGKNKKWSGSSSCFCVPILWAKYMRQSFQDVTDGEWFHVSARPITFLPLYYSYFNHICEKEKKISATSLSWSAQCQAILY